MQNGEIYELEKSVWTEEDFSEMGWHDCLIYGMASIIDEKEDWKNELYFDIDYIFQWVEPSPPSGHFTFHVAPCTLIFKNYYDLIIDADLSFTHFLEILDLNLIEKIENKNNHLICYCWEIELRNGFIRLKSESYSQIVRKRPIHSKYQSLNIDQRGGLSFDKMPFVKI